MNRYLFKTTTTMKEYNCKKWWIDSDIITSLTIEANNLKEALKQYQKIVKDRFYIEISNSALKNKTPMFIDKNVPIQVGFVLTAKTEFDDRENYKWSTQYIDLWVNISIVKNPFEVE